MLSVLDEDTETWVSSCLGGFPLGKMVARYIMARARRQTKMSMLTSMVRGLDLDWVLIAVG